MATYQELYDDVVTITKRPDLAAETALAIRAATLKLHQSDFYFKDLFEKYASEFAQLGINPNNGLGDLYAKIEALPADKKAAIEADIQAIYTKNPAL